MAQITLYIPDGMMREVRKLKSMFPKNQSLSGWFVRAVTQALNQGLDAKGEDENGTVEDKIDATVRKVKASARTIVDCFQTLEKTGSVPFLSRKKKEGYGTYVVSE